MMSIQKKLFVILFFSFSFSSHAQWIAQRAMPSEHFTFRPMKESVGLIVGSITFPKEKAKFNGYYFMVSAVSEDKKTRKRNSQEFFVRPEQIFKLKHQGETDEGLTYLFVMKRPEGQYVINNIRLVSMGYMASWTDIITNFEIPIEVKNGVITYVGNIVFNEHAVVGEPTLSIGNTFERDIKLAQLLQPYVIWKMAINNPDPQIIYK